MEFKFKTPKLKTFELDKLSWSKACEKYKEYTSQLGKEIMEATKRLSYRDEKYKKLYDSLYKESDRVYDYLIARRKERNEYTDLELEFRQALKEAKPLIEDKIKEAEKLLEEAKKISEQYGIPFTSTISPHGQTYWPATGKKFSEIDDILGEYYELHDQPEFGWYGWEHSSGYGSCQGY